MDKDAKVLISVLLVVSIVLFGAVFSMEKIKTERYETCLKSNQENCINILNM